MFTIRAGYADDIELKTSVEKVREFYEALSQEQGVDLSSEGEGQVYAEPVLFRRALINLITNALRFTPSGGRVTVSLQHRDGASEVAVADTGCGSGSRRVDLGKPRGEPIGSFGHELVGAARLLGKVIDLTAERGGFLGRFAADRADLLSE